MLRIANVTLARGSRILLKDASVTVFPGHKVGLVGPNGAGKSSLFALIRDELHADAGDVSLPAAWTVAHVAQETAAVDTPAIDFVLDGDRELRRIERDLAEAEAAHDEGETIAHLHVRYDEIGGYAARSRAASLLSGLGFGEAEQARSVKLFSGGWRMRLNLAQALMCRSDLLLLDEPTNHLDLDAVLWLEEWLGAYPGAVLLITHDRDFLDAVAKTIVHVDGDKLVSYTGGYSDFEAQRAERLSMQKAAYEKQQRNIAHLHAFIDRFRAKATKAKQAQSRLKTLERMERIAAAHVDSPFEFVFRKPAALPRQLFTLEDAQIGYGDKPVLSGVNWAMLGGERIGVLGPNGAGKSTLLKAVVGDLPLIAGSQTRAQGLAVGYFAQHQVDQLRIEHNALWHMGKLTGDREQVVRDFLGGFDFRGERVMAPVSEFSGGEKARLALALIVWQKPNLLVLDEPTNHLDIEMREALAEALQDYEGGLIVVAHDRHLLKATTDQWLLVADGAARPFDGDLDDYREWARAWHSRGSAPRGESTTADRKAQKRTEADQRRRLSEARKPFEKKLSAIERELAPLNDEAKALSAWLAGGDAYGEENRAKLQEATRRQGELATRVAQLEENWLRVQADLDRAVNAAQAGAVS
jgi:ATP-binding cassette subfamily F protein 3